MFAKSLPNTKKRELLKIVRLLQIFDAPLLWDGKTEEEITGNTNLSEISFYISDFLKELWVNTARIYGDEDDLSENDFTGIIDKLLNEIRALRITRQNNEDERLKVAAAVLHEIINDASQFDPSASWPFPTSSDCAAEKKSSETTKNSRLEEKYSRIVLFEAMRLSGILTESKRNLLQVASVAYGIDGESFNELLAQALALHKEMKRSVNLVLE